MFKKFAAIALLAFVSTAASAADLPSYPFIHASGASSGYAMADHGEVDFEIFVQDADPEAALATVEGRLTAIRTLLADLGIAPEDVETRDVRREIRQDANAAPGVVLYDLKCSVHIKVKDLTKWKDVMTPLIVMPNLSGFMTDFGTTRREAIEMELMAEAIASARRKAEAMAKGFGKKLGAVNAVTSGDLKNLSRAMGLSPTELRGRAGGGTPGDRNALLSIGIPKFAQSVDVIFRIK